MKMKKLGSIVLCAAFVMGALAGCGGDKLDGSAIAATVNGEEVSVGLLSLRSHYDEAMYNTYYSPYFGADSYFDDIAVEADEEAGTPAKTYGDQAVDQMLEAVEQDVIIAQHAEEYGVALTEEDKAEMEAIADAYLASNDKSVINAVGARKEDVVRSLELEKIRALMMTAMTEDVDTNIPDSEANQASITYVMVAIAQEGDTDDDGNEIDVTEANTKTMEEMNEVLQKILDSEDPATADMDALAKEVNEEFSAYEANFGPEAEVNYLDETLVEKAKTLSDGEVLEEVFTNEAEEYYYIVRMDSTYDEEATNEHRESLIKERLGARYNEIKDGWVEEAEIETFEDVVRLIKITDQKKYMFKQPETTGGE